MDKFLIDGYNFLFRRGTKGPSLEKKRQNLLEQFNDELISLRLNVSIVFDGSDSIRSYAQRGKFDSLEVVYTTDQQTADEYIIEVIQHAKHPATYIVVTADRGLERICSRLGAKTQSIEDFLAFVQKKQKKVEKTKTPLKITSSEMKRLLKIFEERLNGE